jgi:hypothetical protein
MPRDSSGNYTLPTGNPVITGTVVSSSWANTTMSDIATVLTASLDRSGNGGMLVGFKLTDGTVGAPGLAFTNEPTTGLWRQSANTLGITIGGTNQITLSPTVLTTLGQMVTLGAASSSNNTLIVNAASGAAALKVVQTGTGNGITVDISNTGDVFFASGAAATQLNAFSFQQAGQSQWTIYQPASDSDFRISDGTQDVLVLTNTGAVVIDTPSNTGVTTLLLGSNDQAGLGINAAVAALEVTSNADSVNSGGAIVFSANFGAGKFGAIKGCITNASGNSVGDLSIQLRAAPGNSTLTEVVHIPSTGGVVIQQPTGGTTLLVGPGGSGDVTLNVQGGASGIHSTIIADSAGNQFNAGFLEVPSISVSANRTTVLSDSGKMVQMGASGTTQTIAANASVPYPVGTTLTFVNFSAGNTTIAINSDTLLFFGTGASGSRTLAAGGRATAIKLTSTIWGISGVNLS